MSTDAHSAHELALDRLKSLQISSSSPPSSLAGAASTTSPPPLLAYLDLLPDELIGAIIDHLQNDYCCDEVLALGQCDRRLAALVRSKRWQVIDSRHYRNPFALQELRKHADLVRRVAIRVGRSEHTLSFPFLTALSTSRCEYRLVVPLNQAWNAHEMISKLSPYLKILTIKLDSARDSRALFEPLTAITDPEATYDLLMRLHDQKSGAEDLADPLPGALAECMLLQYLSLEFLTAQLHSTFSPLNGSAVSSVLTRIELCCNAISLQDFTAFLANPAAAKLVVVKIKASLIGVHVDVQPALLMRLRRLELVANPRGSRHISAIDWPTFALPHLVDPSTPFEILALQSASPIGIYDALEAFERTQPVKTLKQVRVLAANEYWSTRFSSDFQALADKLRIWTAQTGVRTEVIW